MSSITGLKEQSGSGAEGAGDASAVRVNETGPGFSG